MCTVKFTLTDRHSNSIQSQTELVLRNWLKLIQGNRIEFQSDKSKSFGCCNIYNNRRYAYTHPGARSKIMTKSIFRICSLSSLISALFWV